MAISEKNIPKVSTFFQRCSTLVESPDWLDLLMPKLSALAKCADSGDIVIVATDPSADTRLSAFIVASAGRLVYRLDADVYIEEERAFWSFASANYLWITPTLALRKEIAARVGGKADGQSLKLADDAITLDQFVDELLKSVKLERPVKVKPQREIAAGAAPSIQGASLPAEAGPPTPVPEILPVPEVLPPARVVDLAVGQTMAMF